jgi:hypothetical protein
MSLPDLGRLTLCPTGVTNDTEAGSSQSVAESPQQEVLQNTDLRRLIESKLLDKDAGDIGEFAPPLTYSTTRELGTVLAGKILSKLLDGDTEDACRAAAKWCNLSKGNKKSCADGGYEMLTAAFFPEARTKPPHFTEEDWFFHMCYEFTHKPKQQRYEELKQAYEASIAERELFYDHDEGAGRLFESYELQTEAINRANAKIRQLRADTERWNTKMELGKARDAANSLEHAITKLSEHAFQVLLKTRLPEYRNTPLSGQFKTYIDQIQMERLEIFLKRYTGKDLSSGEENRKRLLQWAGMLKWSVKRLEELMERSKATGEEVARMQDAALAQGPRVLGPWQVAPPQL